MGLDQVTIDDALNAFEDDIEVINAISLDTILRTVVAILLAAVSYHRCPTANAALDVSMCRYGRFQACYEYLIEHGAELAAELALANAVDPSDVDVDATLNVSLE